MGVNDDFPFKYLAYIEMGVPVHAKQWKSSPAHWPYLGQEGQLERILNA